MGFFSGDMESLVEIYQREAAELMEEYNGHLMKMAQEGKIGQDDVNSIFRVVHTIKSSSAMIGLDILSECTHRMEDLLLLFRDDVKRALGNENRVIDLLYAYSDYIGNEMAALASEDFEPGSADSLRTAINEELNFFAGQSSDTGESKREPEPSRPADAPSGEKSAITLHIVFRENCKMENVRAYQIMKQIRPHCISLSSLPDNLDKKGAAEQIRSSGLVLTLTSEHPDKVDKVLQASPYIKEIKDLDQSEEEGGGGEEKEREEGAKRQTNRSEPEEKSPGKASKFGMVAWDKIVAMQNVTGELITAYTLLKNALEDSEVFKEMEGYLVSNRRLLADLEALVTEASMTPVSGIASQYYRLIRDISKNESKQVEFHLFGEEIELDRSLLDAMSNPLIHLIRNAVDHGIELPEERAAQGKPPVGTVKLTVESLGGNARFTVSDDGKGIDVQAVLKKAKERGILTRPESEYTETEICHFIFAPGFTTTKTANQYSGRGVGMDVVQKTVDTLGGVIHVESELGKGASFIMEVPISMSSVECIGFAVGQYACLIPLRNVETIIAGQDAEALLRKMDGRLWLEWQEEMLPVVDLFRTFSEPEESAYRLILIRGLEHSAVLRTGEIKGEQTAVEKPLPAMLGTAYRNRYGVSGCSVVSSGKLGLVLSAELLLKIAAEKGSE